MAQPEVRPESSKYFFTSTFVILSHERVDNDFIMPFELVRFTDMSYARHTPSERGSALPPSTSSRVPRVRHSTISSTVPPLEADLVVGKLLVRKYV